MVYDKYLKDVHEYIFDKIYKDYKKCSFGIFSIDAVKETQNTLKIGSIEIKYTLTVAKEFDPFYNIGTQYIMDSICYKDNLMFKDGFSSYKTYILDITDEIVDKYKELIKSSYEQEIISESIKTTNKKGGVNVSL